MMTASAVKELTKSRAKLDELIALEKKEYQTFLSMSPGDPYFRAQRTIYQCVAGRRHKVEDKIKELESTGISAADKRKVAAEIHGPKFVKILSERSFGFRNYTYAGWSETLKSFITVSAYRYTSFMDNVKGCSRLSNTSGIDSVTEVTEEQLDALFAVGCRLVSIAHKEDNYSPITVKASELKTR